jgi:hypothetical protein
MEDFLCARCKALCVTVACEACGVYICDDCARYEHDACLCARCAAEPPPRCLLCGDARAGFWTCAGCDVHVCRRCAPSNRRPDVFFARDRCAACVRKRRRPVELDALKPVFDALPAAVHEALAAAVT